MPQYTSSPSRPARLAVLMVCFCLLVAQASAKEGSGWSRQIGNLRPATAPEGALPGEGRFARVWDTISPDGAHVLGWGRPGASSLKYTVIPAHSDESLWTDLSDESMENYLVDSVRGRIVGKLADFHYFPSKQRHHLICGWSPDARAGVAMFQARWANGFESRAIAYIDSVHGRSYPIVAAMNAIMSRLWPDEVKRNGDSIPFFDPVMLDAHTFVVDAFGWPPSDKPHFAWRLAFRVNVKHSGAQVILLKRRPIPEDDDLDPYDGGMDIEAKEQMLRDAYGELRFTLGPRDRRLLKESQARWLHFRRLYGLSDEFSRRRVRELLVRAKWR